MAKGSASGRVGVWLLASVNPPQYNKGESEKITDFRNYVLRHLTRKNIKRSVF